MKKTDLYLKPGTYIKSSTTSGEVQGISLENFVVSVLNNPTCCPKPPGSPDGMLMTALPLNLTLQTVTDFVGNNSAIQLSTLRLGIRSDSSVTTQVSSVIQATTTNANLVIAPNGTGALVASIPDGTATGGNARGTNAVDLQTSKNVNTQVASGQYSNISGGRGNTASSTYSVVGGGHDNNNSSLGSTIAGGRSNTNSATSDATIGGGNSNTVSSQYGVISGGQSNTASTGTHATVVGGKSNTASGNYSVSGGQNATASGTRSIAFGESAVATGTNSVCLGGGSAQGAASTALAGSGNNALSTYSLAQGYVTQTDLYGQISFTGTAFVTDFSERGFCQQSTLVANREATLTTGGTTVLSLDGTGVTNLIIPNGNNRMWNVQVRWVTVVKSITGTATGVTVGDTKTSTDLLAVAKRSGTTTVSAHTSAGTHAIETIAGSLTAANITYTAGASQQMAITFTGPTFIGGGSVTMRVVAAISLTEVAY
jgi:hypothetical protein